jgi:hypothetical protein
MARPLVFALLLIFVLSRAPAAELDEIRSQVFVVSPLFFGEEGKLPKTPAGLIDLREYLKIREIEIPANGEATYDPKMHTATVRAPEDVLQKAEAIFADFGPVAVRMLFTLVEFSVPDAVELPDMGYEQMRKLAGDSWRVKDRVSLIGKSGMKVTNTMLGKNGPAGKTTAAAKQKEEPGDGPIAPHLFGTTVEAEPQIGPDGVTVDLSFVYNYRVRSAPDQPPMVMQTQSNAVLTHNAPLVVQTATLAPPKGEAHAPARELAVVVQVNVLDRYGRSLTAEVAPVAGAPTDPKR